MKIVVSEAALTDIERLQSFLNQRNRDAAHRAAITLSNAISSLAELSERGRWTEVRNVRELVVPFGRAAYVVRYAVVAEQDELIVLRIWHGREQRPSYTALVASVSS